jgi:hypothetical protein
VTAGRLHLPDCTAVDACFLVDVLVDTLLRNGCNQGGERRERYSGDFKTAYDFDPDLPNKRVWNELF